MVSLLAIGGCTTTYRWTPGHGGPPGTRARSTQTSGQTSEQSRWAHLFVFGLIGTSSVDLRDVCPGPVGAGLRTGMTFKTTLVSVLTLGIYTPLEHRFSCVIPPPGPLTIPKVVLEETPSLQPELDDWVVPREVDRSRLADEADELELRQERSGELTEDEGVGEGADDEAAATAITHELPRAPQEAADEDGAALQGGEVELDAEDPEGAPEDPGTGESRDIPALPRDDGETT